MVEYNILIGGKAGEGIKFGAELIARTFNNLGYHIFGYIDYPSLIKGGHNFAVIRATGKDVWSHNSKYDVIIALDNNTIERHRKNLKENGIILSEEMIKSREIIKSLGLPPIVRNTVMVGALFGALGADFEYLEEAIKESLKKKIEENIEAAKKGYEVGRNVETRLKIERIGEKRGKILTGNEATALGMIKAGLRVYLAYPMTPSTPILHFLIENRKKFGIKVYQPENEISVINMAVGSAYAGARTAIGTSGGGFGLMIEGLSLIGMSETPLLIIEVQRAGPSTGTPTYHLQGDLFHAIFSGHGEFPRIVIAPGDADEAFYYSGKGLNLAWKFQIPVIFLSDKHLGESLYTATFNENEVKPEDFKLWDGKGEYKRYKITEDGISPLAFPGTKNAIVKATSYEHDEFGITTEDPEIIAKMQEKRRRKWNAIKEYLKREKTINKIGNSNDVVLVTWGSTKGVVWDVAKELGLKAVQPIYLEPLPDWELKRELENAEKIIDIEVNSTGLFARLLKMYGIDVHEKVLKYDARPFTFDELLEKIQEVI